MIMKFAFLPNYFKKIGLIGFFAAFAVIIISSIVSIISSYQEILANYPDFADGSFADSYELGHTLGVEFMKANYWIAKLSSILLLLSIACYMLAKEKIDDEYIDAMRWDALRLSVIISIGITILFIVFTTYQMPARILLLIQFIAYLIIFKMKKSKKFKE
jgi:hypothetical protein